MKGQLPLGLLVLNAGVNRNREEIVAEAVRSVRKTIGPVAAFRLCTIVDRLPKTRSGKILRGTMRCIADRETWQMPATIEDASVLDEITTALHSLGFGHE
jgi:propionyl-CoA synthetase